MAPNCRLDRAPCLTTVGLDIAAAAIANPDYPCRPCSPEANARARLRLQAQRRGEGTTFLAVASWAGQAAVPVGAAAHGVQAAEEAAAFPTFEHHSGAGVSSYLAGRGTLGGLPLVCTTEPLISRGMKRLSNEGSKKLAPPNVAVGMMQLLMCWTSGCMIS
jgi:hypothetical protein